MKGYIEYLIRECEELERELSRENLHIEVPYLADAYKKWMYKIDHKKEHVVDAYISYIKSADRDLFLFEDDFFDLLPKKIQEGDFDEVAALFDSYTSIIDDRMKDSRKEDVGISTKKLSNYRCAFKNYRKFIVNWLIPRKKKHANITDKNTVIQVPELEELFAKEKFLVWLINYRHIGKGSANSHVSRLNQVNKILSTRFSSIAQRPIDTFYTFITKNLQEGKYTVAHDYLIKIINKFKQKINQQDESLIPLCSLKSCNSALHMYDKFILEEYVSEYHTAAE